MTSAKEGEREYAAVVLNVRRMVLDTGRQLDLRVRRRGNIVWFKCIDIVMSGAAGGAPLSADSSKKLREALKC